jgi:hypothetical protein
MMKYVNLETNAANVWTVKGTLYVAYYDTCKFRLRRCADKNTSSVIDEQRTHWAHMYAGNSLSATDYQHAEDCIHVLRSLFFYILSR